MDILFLYLVIILSFLILENRYLGLSHIIFFNGKFINPYKNKVRFVFLVERLSTNCLGEEKKTKNIVKSFNQNDSRLAVTDNALLIGKRYLSYSYKVDISNIVYIESTVRNRFIFKTISVIFHIENQEHNCILKFDYWVFLARQFKKIYNAIHLMDNQENKRVGDK